MYFCDDACSDHARIVTASSGHRSREMDLCLHHCRPLAVRSATLYTAAEVEHDLNKDTAKFATVTPAVPMRHTGQDEVMNIWVGVTLPNGLCSASSRNMMSLMVCMPARSGSISRASVAVPKGASSTSVFSTPWKLMAGWPCCALVPARAAPESHDLLPCLMPYMS